ncbi:MAG: hypothetical protein AABY22_20455 [Nanoarchaeota archaeon]
MTNITDKTTEILNFAFNELQSVYSGSKEFLAEETPKYISELLNYEFTYGLGTIIFSLILCILFVLAFKKIFNLSKGEPDEAWTVLYIPCSIFFIWFFCYFVFNIQKVVKISIAPRVFVVDYIKDQIK